LDEVAGIGIKARGFDSYGDEDFWDTVSEVLF